MYHSGKIYISTNVRFTENSIPFSNDPNFSKQDSISQNDFATLLKRFQVVYFYLDSSHEVMQLAVAHSYFQDIYGNMEQSANCNQNET